MSLRKVQIGVMGSCADLEYAAETVKVAEDIGRLIAESGSAMIFGAEKDLDSLSTAACRGAKRAGGLTIGVTYGKGRDVREPNVDVVIASGLGRGGGREFALVLSCDAIICISGGSGTLTEMAIAYQSGVPIVAMRGFGGWSDRLADQYLDDRRTRLIEGADTPKDAVTKALNAVASRR